MQSLLSATSLHFSYDARPVLADVAVSLAPGEVVALLGPNGSGKSTLIKLLLGHLTGAGEIAWSDRPLRQWRQRDLARLVAYLPQSPGYEPQQTVVDVIRLGRSPYWSSFGIESQRDVDVVRDTAALLGLSEFLSRSMDSLSGGQRQRVFVGRCLAQEPGAMLLDEPSTFLDLRHQVDLCKLLRRLAREKQLGVLMASHDLTLAGAFADRVLLLDAGKIAAAGAPVDVLQPDILQKVYGVPIERLDRGPGKPPAIFPVAEEERIVATDKKSDEHR